MDKKFIIKLDAGLYKLAKVSMVSDKHRKFKTIEEYLNELVKDGIRDVLRNHYNRADFDIILNALLDK